MDPNTLGLIAVLIILLCFSAFFSSSETSFSSLSRIKLKNLAARNNRKAKLALRLLDKYDNILSTVLIGNNIVNISASALATVLFVGFFGSAGVSIATLVMTVLVLIFGEITPKTLAKESPEKTAMAFAPLIRVFVFLFAPVNRLSGVWKRTIVKLFHVGGDRTVTEDELLTFVEEVRQEGGINRQEEEMIRQAIEFDDITAGEIYTPRIDVAAVSEEDTAEAMDKKFYETGFSRLPVYRNNIDHIIGVILLKDFHHEVIKQDKSPAAIIKPVVFITKSMKAAKLLRTLQQKQSHMAVLVDEFGGTVGIVTIEDIVEELVGEIWDEHDQVVETIVDRGDGTFRVLGNSNLEDMFDFFDIKKDDAGSAAVPKTTVGNWVMENIGGVPRFGDKFALQNLEVRVSKVTRHRVMEITVIPGGGKSAGEGGAVPAAHTGTEEQGAGGESGGEK
ncbi:MAG: hemolysin family protein [Treponema sp.]|jgi:CBS domain containing-hemolysin-like protein|nr:hemolysin family protein [Treponema sp.]